jgi:hypothetical protein
MQGQIEALDALTPQVGAVEVVRAIARRALEVAAESGGVFAPRCACCGKASCSCGEGCAMRGETHGKTHSVRVACGGADHPSGRACEACDGGGTVCKACKACNGGAKRAKHARVLAQRAKHVKAEAQHATHAVEAAQHAKRVVEKRQRVMCVDKMAQRANHAVLERSVSADKGHRLLIETRGSL